MGDKVFNLSKATLEVQIENTTTCIASCHFCVYPKVKSMRAGKSMSMDLFRKIIDELATIPLVDLVKVIGLNEPLMDPLLEERFAYCKKMMPHVPTQVYTNGVLLTPERHDSLRAAGLDSIIVSLNAISEKQHREIMGLKDKFDITCANCDYAIQENKKDPRKAFEIHAVANKDKFKGGDIIDFYIRWGHAGEGGYGLCVWEANWAGDNRTVRHDWKPSDSCWRALSQIYIMYDGRVSTCCLDPTGKQVFGDLKTQTIREVYNNDPFLQFRIDHHNNKADRYAICKGCTRI